MVKLLIINGTGELEGAFEEVALIIKCKRKNRVGEGAVGLLACAGSAEVLWDAANPDSSKIMLLTLRAQK